MSCAFALVRAALAAYAALEALAATFIGEQPIRSAPLCSTSAQLLICAGRSLKVAIQSGRNHARVNSANSRSRE